jgi:hypothetical protein
MSAVGCGPPFAANETMSAIRSRPDVLKPVLERLRLQAFVQPISARRAHASGTSSSCGAVSASGRSARAGAVGGSSKRKQGGS